MTTHVATADAPNPALLFSPTLVAPALTTITPSWAAAALARNRINRKEKLGKIAEYTEHMLAGEWTITHQGIAFYSTGDICDGQNRLRAVVRSGVTVQMFVTYGLQRKAGSNIDNGGVRTAADSIMIAGECKWLNAAAISLVKATSNRQFIATNANMVHRAHRYEPSYRFVLNLFSSKRKGLTTASVQAACVLAHANGIGESLLRELRDVLMSGVMTHSKQVAFIRLRESLLRNMSQYSGDMEKQDTIKRAQRAILAVHEGEELRSLITPKNFIWPLFND